MRIPMAAPARQYQFLREELDTAVLSSLASGNYIGGEAVQILERELANFLGLEEWGVVSCANGTDALEIAYEAVGLEAGDEVLVPTHNYVAAAEAARRLGLIPVWADCGGIHAGAQCFNIDLDSLEVLITPRTRALIAVNLYGMPVEATALKAFCRAHNLVFIEDNAQGLGGYAQSVDEIVPMGRLGDISTTSFFPTKPLGCAGDGGAIFTDNPHWAARARCIARHGQSDTKYDYQMVGRNSRLDALQAEILRIKLAYLPHFVRLNQEIAQRYTEGLANLSSLNLPTSYQHSPTFHQYTLILDDSVDRELIRQALIAHGIASGLYYPQPLHQYTVYAARSIIRGSLEHSEYISRHMLSLPIFPLMTDTEVDYVLQTLHALIH